MILIKLGPIELSCSNVGARKMRNIRDHLFIIYGIINDVINGNSDCIDVVLYNVKKCFYEMWFQETHNDLYDVKIDNDHLALITKLDEEGSARVKTPFGPTDEFKVQRNIMQGSVLGPIKCSVQIDTIGRSCIVENEGLYLYKDSINITPLSMIDDIAGVSKCGADSINYIINAKI